MKLRNDTPLPKETDRRCAERLPVAINAYCQIGDARLRARVTDISLGGMYLKDLEVGVEGSPVRASIGIPIEHGVRVCKLQGAVTRADRDESGRSRGLGVSFDLKQASVTDRVALAWFIQMRGCTLTTVC